MDHPSEITAESTRTVSGSASTKSKTWTVQGAPVVRVQVRGATLRFPDDPDEALVMHTVEEGSPSHVALQLLATWAQEGVAVGS